MNKTLAFFFVITLLFTCCANAYADEELAPCATTGHNVAASVSVSGGTGTVQVTVKLLSGYSASTTVRVQKLVNGAWTTFQTLTGTTKIAATFSASSGVSYRVYVISNITETSTGTVECVTQYSSPQSY